MIEIPDINEIGNESIDKALNNETKIYTSVDRAAQDVEGLSANNLYKPSFEHAEVGDYYTYENGSISKITEEEAQKLFEDGKTVVASVENDDVVIGYTNISK